MSLITISLLVLFASNTFAAELKQDEPQTWGGFTARFVYDGPAPKPNYFKIPPIHGLPSELRDESLLVDPKNHGLRNVCIWLNVKDVPVHPDLVEQAKKPIVLSVINHQCSPRVAVAYKGRTVELREMGGNQGAIQLSMLESHGERPVLKPSVTRVVVSTPTQLQLITCSIRPWVKLYAICPPNLYAGVSQEDGRLTIADLPAGEWEFRAWHERAGYLMSRSGKFRVKIEAGKTTDLGDVKIDPKEFPD